MYLSFLKFPREKYGRLTRNVTHYVCHIPNHLPSCVEGTKKVTPLPRKCGNGNIAFLGWGTT